MTYPLPAPRESDEWIRATPLNNGGGRSSAWKAFSKDLRHASRKTQGHHETTARRGEFYFGQNKLIQEKGATYVMKMSLFDLTSKAELLRRTTTFIAAPVPADRTKLETFGRQQTRGTKTWLGINPHSRTLIEYKKYLEKFKPSTWWTTICA